MKKLFYLLSVGLITTFLLSCERMEDEKSNHEKKQHSSTIKMHKGSIAEDVDPKDIIPPRR